MREEEKVWVPISTHSSAWYLVNPSVRYNLWTASFAQLSILLWNSLSSLHSPLGNNNELMPQAFSSPDMTNPEVSDSLHASWTPVAEWAWYFSFAFVIMPMSFLQWTQYSRFSHKHWTERKADFSRPADYAHTNTGPYAAGFCCCQGTLLTCVHLVLHHDPQLFLLQYSFSDGQPPNFTYAQSYSSSGGGLLSLNLMRLLSVDLYSQLTSQYTNCFPILPLSVKLLRKHSASSCKLE